MRGAFCRNPRPKFRQCPVSPSAHPLIRQCFMIMKAEGLAQLDVAERAGVDHTTMVKWKRVRNPNVSSLQAVLNAIGYELVIRKKRGE